MSVFPTVGRDDASAAFFEAAAQGKLLVQACTSCGTVVGPEVRTCPGCGGAELVPQVAGGTGTLVSWVTVHQPPVPALAEAVPYVSGIVELDEGPWLIVRLVDVAEPAVGLPVATCFVPGGEGETLPAFGPAS